MNVFACGWGELGGSSNCSKGTGEAVQELLSLEPVFVNTGMNSRILSWKEWAILVVGMLLTVAVQTLWQEVKNLARSVCRSVVARAQPEATGKSKRDEGAVGSGKDGIEIATLMKLKQKELSNLCRARGLAYSGTKEVLASRLSQFFAK